MKSKKIIIVVLVVSILLSISVAYADNIEQAIKVSFTDVKKIHYNGSDITPIKNKLFVYEQTTYVPLREVLDAIGKKVNWNQETKNVEISDNVIDAKASASVTYFYEGSSLKGEDLLKAITERKCAISVATVNADGSPNAAVVIPAVADAETLMFGLADNQTKVNLMERKQAVVTAYIYNPTAENKLERNVGARLVVEYISDEAKINELNEKTKLKGMMYVKILEIKPLG
jgi:uncharacterized protein YnzC (UPF0291/DUF896 family)